MSRSHVLIVASTVLTLAACGEAATTPTTSLAETAAPSTSSPAAATTATTALPVATTTTSSVLAEPGPGGVVVIGINSVPPTLNPYAPGGDSLIVATVGQAIHTGVWDVDGTSLERIPEVVVELPTVANGGVTVNEDGTMTVRYAIRDEAHWADGTPISGADFAFTHETLAGAHEVASQGARFEDYALIDPASIEVSATTFAFTMTRPTLAHEGLFRWLIPRHQVEGSDVMADWNTEPWMSGGPFTFAAWDRTGAESPGTGSIRLVRNESYWKQDDRGAPLPYLDEVTFEFVPETQALLRAFAKRELDVVNPPPWMSEVERVLGPTMDEGAVVTVRNGPIWEHFNFQFGELNRNEDSLNRHLAFRRAVSHAIDREAITADLLSGYAGALSSYVDVFTPGLSGTAWNRYDYDPGEARRLLAELCAELERNCDVDPPKVVFSTTSNAEARPRIAKMLVEMLSAVGIDVELQLEDSQKFFGPTLDRGDWDMGLWAWVGAPGLQPLVEFHDVFDPHGPPPDAFNYYRWGTPAVAGSAARLDGPGADIDVTQGPSTVIDDHTQRFAELVDAMAATVDENEVTALIAEAESILADQVVIIPLYSRLVVNAYWADQIAGVETNTSQAGHTWNIEHWYRADT